MDGGKRSALSTHIGGPMGSSGQGVVLQKCPALWQGTRLRSHRTRASPREEKQLLLNPWATPSAARTIRVLMVKREPLQSRACQLPLQSLDLEFLFDGAEINIL